MLRGALVRSNCRGVGADKPFETVEKQLLRAEPQFSVIVVKARPPPVVVVAVVDRRSSVGYGVHLGSALELHGRKWRHLPVQWPARRTRCSPSCLHWNGHLSPPEVLIFFLLSLSPLLSFFPSGSPPCEPETRKSEYMCRVIDSTER